MPTLKVISFMLKDRCFALPSRQVGEIIDSAENLKKTFHVGDALSGVISYEGNLVSIINLPFLLDMGSGIEKPLILMCRDKDEALNTGLTVSEVVGIQMIDSTRIKPNTSSNSPWLLGSIRTEEEGSQKLISIIDLGRLFDYSLKNIGRKKVQATADHIAV